MIATDIRESNSFPDGCRSFRGRDGAVIHSSVDLEPIALSNAFARPALQRDDEGGGFLSFSVSGSDLWTSTSTSLQRVEEALNLDIRSLVLDRARIQQFVTVLDWGCGDGTALDELSKHLRSNGVDNVRLVGFGNFYFPNWKNLNAPIELIWDTANYLPRYFCNKPEIDILYSYDGIRHLGSDLPKHQESLMNMIKPGGSITFNKSYFRDDIFHYRREEQPLAA